MLLSTGRSFYTLIISHTDFNLFIHMYIYFMIFIYLKFTKNSPLKKKKKQFNVK